MAKRGRVIAPVSEIARKALGIKDTDDPNLLRDLFFFTHWPEPFCEDYGKAKDNPHARAQIAAKRIKHFIDTGL